MTEAQQLRAVIARLAAQISVGRPPVELMETIREGTCGSSGRRVHATVPGIATFTVLEKKD